MKNSINVKNGKLFLFFLIVGLGAMICPAQSEKTAKFSLFATDKNGGFAGNLTKDDLAVSVDGKEQANFTLESETAPLVYLLAVDNSGSMRLFFDDIKLSAKTIIEKNKPEDSASLLRFVDAKKIEPAEKFTSDRNYLLKVLDQYYIEGGQTALVDAIYKSVELVGAQQAASENARRAVVVISDGEDRESTRTKAQLVELLKKTNVQIFFIGLVNELPDKKGKQNLILIDKDGKPAKMKEKYTSSRTPAVDLIETLARESGGAAVYPAKNQKISAFAEQLAAQMRTQFVVKVSLAENITNAKIEVRPAKSAEKRNLRFYYRADQTR